MQRSPTCGSGELVESDLDSVRLHPDLSGTGTGVHRRCELQNVLCSFYMEKEKENHDACEQQRTRKHTEASADGQHQ